MVISGGIVWPVNWKRADPVVQGAEVRDKPGSSQRLGGKVCCNHALSLCLCCTALQVCSSTSVCSCYCLQPQELCSQTDREFEFWVTIYPMWPLTSEPRFLIALQIFDDCNEPPYIMHPVELSQY